VELLQSLDTGITKNIFVATPYDQFAIFKFQHLKGLQKSIHSRL
jgi:hypothetical protein